MSLYLPALLFVTSVFALEVIRPQHSEKILLKIVRAQPDSFETYTLTNHNGREMDLVCAKNRVHDNNPKAFIRYRNYYNEIAGDFTIDDDGVCKEMGKFIETSSYGIDEQRPFLILLSTKKMNVEKIKYPNIDPYADKGDVKDLLPKSPVYIESVKPVKGPVIQ